MSRALSDGGGLPLRLVIPDSPEMMPFLVKVYARENPDFASKASLSDYQTQVRTLQKFFNQECLDEGQLGREVRISDVTKPLVLGCMSWLIKRGRVARTANKLRRTILAIHSFAIQEKDHPGELLRVKKYKEPKLTPRAWRPEQIPLILRAAKAMPAIKAPRKRAGEWDGRDDVALILFILNTGTRITAAMLSPKELLELDAPTPCVIVPFNVQKHASDEPFDLLEITVKHLRDKHPSPDGLIFGNWPYDNREKKKWRTITERLKKILVRAGMFPSVREIPKRKEMFHKLRKTFATFVRKKFGKQAAQQLCGHSTDAVTKAYLDETQTGDRPSCCEALDDIIVMPQPPKADPQRRLFD